MSKRKWIPIILVFLIIPSYLFAIFSSEYIVADWFTTDDAFYYFKIAENMTKGEGITFDGLSKTNGFHPLWMIIITPLFYLARFDVFLPLRGIITLQMFFAVGTGLLFFSFLKQECSNYVAFIMSLAWVLIPEIQNTTSNGTEACINAFFITLFWLKISKLDPLFETNRANFRKIFSLGVVALLLVLSRLDNVYLIFPVGLWLIYLFLKGRNGREGGLNLKELIRVEFLFFAPTVGVLLGYLLFNYFYFDTLMPLSGQIKKWWGTLNKTAYGMPVRNLGNYLGDFFSPNTNIGPWSIVTKRIYGFADRYVANRGRRVFSIGLMVELAAAFFVGFLFAERKKDLFKIMRKWALYPLIAGTIIHISHYKLLGYLGSRPWYWIAEAFFVIVLLSIVMELIFRKIKEINFKFINFILFISTIIISAYIVKPSFLYVSENIHQEVAAREHHYFQITNWIESNTEQNALVGMTGAGSTSYFIKDRRIINLDGLVNGREYFDHLKSGEAYIYLQEIGVDYLFVNSHMIQETEPYRSSIGRYLDNDKANKGILKFRLWEIRH